MEQNERFNHIYDETRDALLRHLMLKTNADPEAEDLFQEVYRRFYRRLSGGLPILDPKRYLFAIAKRVLAEFYRKKARRTETEQPMPEDADFVCDDEPIDERLLKAEQTDAVWQLLRREPEQNRRIFLLFYGYDRSQKDIADALGLNEQTVRQRLYRTRQRIRAMLECNEQERKQV